MLKEFKPALLFLSKFLAIYVVGNLAYGVYINHYYPQSDPATKWISHQVSVIISAVGPSVHLLPGATMPTVSIIEDASNISVIDVFEGCNGINVVIVFLAFVVAYKGTLRRTVFFTGIGLVTIHLFNLGRIILLFHQAKNHSPFFYYTHKYFFTAILYVVVVVLWWWWVTKYNGIENDHSGKTQVE